jgi:very-short-patch-repair endonuclease
MANANARVLRKRLTPQEVKLWIKLRGLKSLGFHFRRQAPIGRYIVDFASFGSRVVVEIDGGQHGMPEEAASDQQRDGFLRSQGFRVLRYWNSDVDQNLEGVLESIFSALKTPPRRYAPTLPTQARKCAADFAGEGLGESCYTACAAAPKNRIALRSKKQNALRLQETEKAAPNQERRLPCRISAHPAARIRLV